MPSETRRIEVRYIDAVGNHVETTLDRLDVDGVVRGHPVRIPRSSPGRRHYSGHFWSSTTQSHVRYESLLEMDRLLVADFAPDVEWIAAQPMWLSGLEGPKRRRHVPDLLIKHRGGSFTLVDVKPRAFLDVPKVAEVFGWTGGVCKARGWRYEVWSGEDPVLIANLRVLCLGRRSELVDDEATRAVVSAATRGMTIGEICDEAGLTGDGCRSALPAVLEQLWLSNWITDLRIPLSRASVIDWDGAEL